MSLPVPAEQTHLIHPKYRGDIDGLRAIAVLIVVIFHAFPNVIQGGFIGVDIFFVISGFLISSIIFSNLANGTFSFAEFYARRVKRIFPALIIVMAACFTFGWFVLFADEYRQLGKHIAGGAGFIQNFFLWNESSYFDNAADTKPLLHLWSLAVEEQFYIIWPLLIWLAWKKRLNLLIMAIAVGLISFGLNVVSVPSDPVGDFYSPQTRFWELMGGAVLAHMTLYKQDAFSNFKHGLDSLAGKIIFAQAPDVNGKTLRNTQSMVGAALIVVGAFVINQDRDFPGGWALMPTLGTFLIISAGAHAWLNHAVLSSRVLVWFGLISYPLYLWHWPLLTFARILESGLPSTAIRIAVILSSIALAWLSYKLIEKPIRYGRHSKAITICLLASMTIVGLVGYYTFSRAGLPFRLHDQQEFLDYFDDSLPEKKLSERLGLFQKYRTECDFYDREQYRKGHATRIPLGEIDKSCYARDTKPKAVFIWGDSHAQQLYFGIAQNLPKEWQILQVASAGCNPKIADPQSDPSIDYCSKSNLFAIEAIKIAKPDVVIVAQNVGHQAQESKTIAAELKSIGVKNIIFTGPTPHWKADLPKIIARDLWHFSPERTNIGIDEIVIQENRTFKAELLKIDDVTFIDLIEFFCNQDGCLTRIGNDRTTDITTFDYGHLMPIASDYLARNLLVPKILHISDKQ